MEGARNEAKLRGSLGAAAALLGVPLEITADDTWQVRDGTVYVGFGFFESLADVDRVTVSMLVLLWESIHEARYAPLRRARRLSLAASHRELEPLLRTIDRLIAVTDVLAAFPGLREAVARMLHGSLFTPETTDHPSELPRHLQWLALATGAFGHATVTRDLRATLAPEVQREWAKLAHRFLPERTNEDGAASADVLRMACAADPARSELKRFERAFAVLEPAYQRLLKLDLASLGLGGNRSRGLGEDKERADSASDDTLSGGKGDCANEHDSAPATDDASEGGEAQNSVSDAADDRARAGDHPDSAEGADLFASEQAGFVDQVLSTPLPADGNWPEGLTSPEIDDASVRPMEESPRDRAGSAGNEGVARSTPLAEYRSRSRELNPQIEALRDVWKQVISERIAMVPEFSRLPEPDGEILDRNRLTHTVAEVIAGVEQPRAFLRRDRRQKRSRRTGSTDYALLIDRSASMQGPSAEAAADAALIMLESLAAVSRDINAEERRLGINLELAIRTSLIVFDSAPVVVKPLSERLDDEARRRMHAEIRSPRGSTNDAAALEAAARELGIVSGKRKTEEPGRKLGVERRRVVIVVSDGGTDDAGEAGRWIRLLRGAGVTVIGVGVRTHDVVNRFAPDGVRLEDPRMLATELARLVAQTGLGDTLHSVGRATAGLAGTSFETRRERQ